MQPTSKPLILLIAFCTLFASLSFAGPGKKRSKRNAETKQKIQAAILLDVSNSMDGLIDQAKQQLWNMVSVMGKTKCGNGETPEIEIALYEYGRSSNDATAGYVKQISGFTTDLDKLSQQLFNLTTNGGDEYCGQVIYTSLDQLNWAPGNDHYKVIFIAGNEDFLQGKLNYTKACNEAKNKGVVVNTIYCGNRADGIREHWNLGAECGNGSFTNINSNAKLEEIPTPYDSILFSLNDKLNGTYIAYGYTGAGKQAMQASMDKLNYAANTTSAAKRVGVKGNAKLYKNESWDLVDRGEVEKSDEFLKQLDKKTLPDSLQKKSTEELKQVITIKKQERSLIQQKIQTTNAQREAFIAEARKKNAVKSSDPNLETEVEKMIKEQAKRYNMKIN